MIIITEWEKRERERVIKGRIYNLQYPNLRVF